MTEELVDPALDDDRTATDAVPSDEEFDDPEDDPAVEHEPVVED